MGSLTKILATDNEVALARKAVAADLTPVEFNMFVHMARQFGLDPLRRQIYGIVYNKDKADRRRVIYVTAIDGYRAIAERTGNYRPGQRSVEQSDDAKDPITNPHGIISATASVYKYAHGSWHEYSETVYWEEFAPLKQIWEYDEKAGRKKPTNRYELDTSGQWPKMGRVMLMKCAEAQALRRGWPDQYSGLYINDEMDRAEIIDITPDKQAEAVEIEERQAKLGGPSILIDWLDNRPLTAVPVGEVHGKVMDLIRQNAEEPMTILAWADRNVEALKQLWAVKKDEALDIKMAIETYRKGAALQ